MKVCQTEKATMTVAFSVGEAYLKTLRHPEFARHCRLAEAAAGGGDIELLRHDCRNGPVDMLPADALVVACG